MTIFHAKQIQKWKEQHISDISCIIISGGCAGNKVMVTEGINPKTDQSIVLDDISIHIEKKYLSLFESARITEAKGKWILTSEKVHTRCGCGTSFSLSTGNALQDKIAHMKLAMKKKKETC